MKAGLLIYGSLDQVTGGYLYDRWVVNGLRARGVDLEVCSLPQVDSGNPVELNAVTAGAALWLEQRRIDVVIGDELCHPVLAELFPVQPRHVSKVLLVHHLQQWETSDSDELRPGTEAEALAAADWIMTTSEETRGRLQRMGIVQELVLAVPGADRLPIVPRPQRGSNARFLFVGNLLAHKRVLELLQAFQALRPSGATLRLAGSEQRAPQYAQELRRFVERSGELAARVEFIGVLDDAALAQAYAEADCLVSCSLVEGYGMGVTEALYAGLPVLMSRTGCAEEFAPSGALQI
ncbi:MAG TPA: glycosyltransferase family 4 protein, partial [Polyangiales bacterium]|nr:glycosyltransferase family 4 protein [Polyangiales bacterium]